MEAREIVLSKIDNLARAAHGAGNDDEARMWKFAALLIKMPWMTWTTPLDMLPDDGEEVAIYTGGGELLRGTFLEGEGEGDATFDTPHVGFSPEEVDWWIYLPSK